MLRGILYSVILCTSRTVEVRINNQSNQPISVPVIHLHMSDLKVKVIAPQPPCLTTSTWAVIHITLDRAEPAAGTPC